MTSLTEQGKKHQPLAYVLENKLIIKVGREIEHPMLKKHLIEDIDLLLVSKAGLIRIKNYHFTEEDSPYIKISLDELKSGVYKIQTKCNVHGTWEDEILI